MFPARDAKTSVFVLVFLANFVVHGVLCVTKSITGIDHFGSLCYKKYRKDRNVSRKGRKDFCIRFGIPCELCGSWRSLRYKKYNRNRPFWFIVLQKVSQGSQCFPQGTQRLLYSFWYSLRTLWFMAFFALQKV